MSFYETKLKKAEIFIVKSALFGEEIVGEWTKMVLFL